MAAKKQKTVWILVKNVTAYNNFGVYFDAAFEKKPSVSCLMELLDIKEKIASAIVEGKEQEHDSVWYELIETEYGVSRGWGNLLK